MAKLIDRLFEEARAFLYSLVFPFHEKGFWNKTPVFILAAFVPFLNIIILRGWRVELTHRMGWNYEQILPSSSLSKMLSYVFKGIKLWIVTGLYLIVPAILIYKLGLRGTGNMIRYFQELFYFLVDYFNGTNSQGIIGFGLSWLFRIIFRGILVFLIENIWLVLYIPMYRIAMIRYALTGKLIYSHLAVVKNFKFLMRNIWTFLLLYGLFFLDSVIKFLVSLVLTMTVILVPLIPVITIFVSYWSSGYDFGLLAQRMVKQEGLEQTKEGRQLGKSFQG
ncbi:MAG: DUF4013 domain-containing protein [Bacteroidetes bacterium]|nr:MAG: DUF4013 domain-containing protein [Bacteroidota bacterium]